MALVKKITEEQQELLIEYMETQRKLRTGKLDSSFTHKDYVTMWEDIAQKLNSCVGARKTTANWRKSWHDMKRNVKDKYARIKSHRRKTRRGVATTEKLTPQQERILALMRPTVVTGHPLQKESAVTETSGSVQQQQDNTTTQSTAAPHNLTALADLNVLNPVDILPSSPGPSTTNSTNGLTQNKDTDACQREEMQNEQAPSKSLSAGTTYTQATRADEVSFKERELELRQREVEARELFVRESLAIIRESERRKATAMENIALALASIASALQRQ